MPFKKGHKLSTGRPKGSENKISAEIKSKLQDVINEAVSQIDITRMNQDQILKLVQVGLGYTIPKLRFTEMETSNSGITEFVNKIYELDPKELQTRIDNQ